MASVTPSLRKPAEPCIAQVRKRDGTPTLFINGRPTFGFAFLGGRTTDLYHEFTAAGGHLYSVECGVGNSQRQGFDSTEVDATFSRVLAQDPQAYVFPRVRVNAPQWWLDAHPEQRVVFDDASYGPQSMASDKWLHDLGEDIAVFVRHVRSSPYADRVIGYHICAGVSDEWQAWGLWSERRGDFSEPMRRAFSAWLKNKYGSTDALRAAWRDLETTLEKVCIPSRQAREAAGPALLEPGESQPIIDFYEFYPTVTARAIQYFARVVKEACNRESLVGVFYGYAPQYGPLAAESQHLALASVLACPDLDFLCSPAMYTDREPGGTTNFMSLTDSVQAHGKFWFDEADLRTHLQADKTSRCETIEETLGVLKREYGCVRAHGAGMWWFDMSGGWFSAPQIHRLFADMQAEGAQALAQEARPRFKPEIGVFFDEKSAYRQRPASFGFYYYGIVTQVASLRRVGAPVALHLLSDLATAPNYKVYLFLNATDLTPDQRELLHTRIQCDGKTVIFIYAPGFGRVDARGIITEDISGLRELTQLNMRVERRPGSMRATLVAGEALCRDPVLLEEYGGADGAFGPHDQCSPRFVISDPTATVLARYADGEPAMAIKRMKDWTVVYSAAPGLPPGLIRNIAADAGVHMFSAAGDALYAGRGVVALHALTTGEKVIRLPGVYDVRQMLDRERSWLATREIKLTLKAKETVVLDVATPRQ